MWESGNTFEIVVLMKYCGNKKVIVEAKDIEVMKVVGIMTLFYGSSYEKR